MFDLDCLEKSWLCGRMVATEEILEDSATDVVGCMDLRKDFRKMGIEARVAACRVPKLRTLQPFVLYAFQNTPHKATHHCPCKHHGQL